MDAKTYQEITEMIEGQRSINEQQAKVIVKLLNQCAEQENMIGSLLSEGYRV